MLLFLLLLLFVVVVAAVVVAVVVVVVVVFVVVVVGCLICSCVSPGCARATMQARLFAFGFPSLVAQAFLFVMLTMTIPKQPITLTINNHQVVVVMIVDCQN